MNKRNVLTKLIGIFIIILLMHITNVSMAAEYEAIAYNEKYAEWMNLPEEEREKTIAPPMYVRNINNYSQRISTFRNSRLLGTISKYSLLDNISLKLKNQQSTGQCWAFSTTTQLESYMAKVKSKTVEFSPRHMEYSTSKTFLDGTNPYGFNREVNVGGNAFLGYTYMTQGQGPVLESDMPFANTSEKINLSEIQGKTVQAQLEEFIYFPAIYKEIENGVITYTNGQTGSNRVEYTKAQVTSVREKVKEHIMTYGAVVAPTATNKTEFFSNQVTPVLSEAYNCDDPSVSADHQITIIGWDDNYAVTNFNEEHRPTSPGAWLIQNSYGTEIADSNGNVFPVFNNGLLYISYEDCLIETMMTGIISLGDVDYDDIYQHDILGETSVIGSSSANEIYMANVFKKDSNVAYLNEVGFYTIAGESYEIYVNSADDKLTGEDFVKVKTVPATDSYYITVELDKPIKLNGSKFAVAIKYISSNNGVTAPVECRLLKSSISNTVVSNEGESYVSVDGTTWDDCKELNITGMSNINACIKAFTTDTSNVVDITLKSNAYTIVAGENVITKVLPETSLTNFKKNLITDGTVKIYYKSGQELADSDMVSTGATLEIVETGDTYQISVMGDLNGDSKVTATDLLKLKKDLVNVEKLTGEYKKAADLNDSSTLTSTDMLKIKQIICKIITL